MEPITHREDIKRFETIQDGYTAYIAYEPFEGGIDLTHTLVPKPLEGKGLASALTRHVLDYAGEDNLKVRPTCPFIKVYVERHPQYRCLVFES